eukprot:2784953-Pyramimonas_sp.AAC.1
MGIYLHGGGRRVLAARPPALPGGRRVRHTVVRAGLLEVVRDAVDAQVRAADRGSRAVRRLGRLRGGTERGFEQRLGKVGCRRWVLRFVARHGGGLGVTSLVGSPLRIWRTMRS